ncbi:MAG TPA: hypothetical protein PLL69_11340 [Gemmatimonadales bacterium]|nr:hypothetical protein [Gemmatimonadales bacterium]
MVLNEMDGRDYVNDILASAEGERLLLIELRSALARQRAGVAQSDAAEIEIASRAVSHAVLTLDQARRRREDLQRLVGHGTAARLESLERHAGPIEGLAELRESLRTEAEGAIADLALTQVVLQGAMQAGDAYLQALFSSVSQVTPSYQPPASTGRPAPRRQVSANLVNRSA